MGDRLEAVNVDGSAEAAELASQKEPPYLWAIPPLVAIAVYCIGLGSFSCFDDFIWLERAQSFRYDWLQIFRPDVIYFDPLVHLMFLAQRLSGSLDPRWYHAVDLLLHAGNALLVYRLARALGGDARSALYGAVLFAGSSSIADAVLWSSSRVDLLSTTFALCSLIAYLRFLRTGKRSRLGLSVLLFILALGAKGTPLVLPGVMLGVLFIERKPLRYLASLAPFALVDLAYLVLLKLNLHRASLPQDRLHLNLDNLVLSMGALFTPESLLKNLNHLLLFVILLAFLSAAAFLVRREELLRRGAWCFMVAALLPVLPLKDFQLVSRGTPLFHLLLSPSHRIYLASVGAALLCGVILRDAERWVQRWSTRAMALSVVVLVAVTAVNWSLVRKRAALWAEVGTEYRLAFQGLARYRGAVTEGSRVGLIGFPGSGGFLTPLAKVALGVHDLELIRSVTIAPVQDRELLEKAERSHLFVQANDGRVYDRSEPFRQQLLYNRQALEHPSDPSYLALCWSVAQSLKREIDLLL